MLKEIQNKRFQAMSAKKKARREKENIEEMEGDENQNRRTYYSEINNENRTMTVLPKYAEIEEKSKLL